MNWINFHRSNMQLMLIIISTCLNLAKVHAQHDNGEKLIVQPEINYGAWNPVDVIDYPVDIKINKARSIQTSPVEPAENSNFNRQRKKSSTGVKVAARRNFESKSNDENPQTTLRPAYKRRTFPSATSTSTTAKTSDTSVKAAKYTRKLNENPSTTFKPRRQYTPRAKAENVITTTPLTPSSSTSRIVFKKPTRGIYRPKSTTKNGANDDGSLTRGGDEENYPEHFKVLLKNKEVAAPTQESDKSVLKKPSKPFRPLPEKTTTKASVKAKPNAVLYAPRQQHRLKVTSEAPTEVPSTYESSTARRATLRTRSPYRPTERTRLNFGSTLQEPPTTKATRTPLSQIVVEESMNVNTQITDDAIKQIDAPADEAYFPRTSAIGSSSALKFSSRFRNSDVTSKPNYEPTVPSIATTPGLEPNDIDLERWREILPLAAELINNDAEIMTQEPSQTVSIYEALAEILSKPTESLNFFNNKSTDRTPFSEAPISSTTTTTQPTTTSTTTTSTTTPPLSSTTESSSADSKVSTTTRVNSSKNTPVYIQTTTKFLSHDPQTHNSTDTTVLILPTTFSPPPIFTLRDLFNSNSINIRMKKQDLMTNHETNGTFEGETNDPNNLLPHMRLPQLDLMTHRVNGEKAISFFPVYKPKSDSNENLILPLNPTQNPFLSLSSSTKLPPSSFTEETTTKRRATSRPTKRKQQQHVEATTTIYAENLTSLTQNSETESAGLIIDLLQKYQNETDAHVKSPNIFSVAKKGSGQDGHNSTEISLSDEFASVSTVDSSSTTQIKSSLPVTPSTVNANSVSIFPNGYDTTSSIELDTFGDLSFENEIFLDKNEKTTTKSTTRTPVRTTYSLTSTLNALKTTSKPLQTSTTTSLSPTTLYSTTSLPTTFSFFPTTTSRPPTTTQQPTTQSESFIDKNFKLLQDLLTTRKMSSISRSTTSIFETTTSKYEPPPTSKYETTTTQPPVKTTTTESFIDKNFFALQDLLAKAPSPFRTTKNVVTTTKSSPVTTTTVDSFDFDSFDIATTPETTTARRTSPAVQKIRTRSPTQSTRYTTVSYTPADTTTLSFSQTARVSTTTPMTTVKQTTMTSPSTTVQKTSTSSPPQTSPPPPPQSTTTQTPSSTHRFVPLVIPTFSPSTTVKKKAPFSNEEDLLFLRNLANFINRVPSTTPMVPKTTSTTVKSTTLSTTPPTTFSTTQRAIFTSRLPTTTFSDTEDIAFLNSLRNYASIINLSTEKPTLADKILELAMNRTSKSVGDSKSSSNNQLSMAVKPAPFATTQSPEIMMTKMKGIEENINLMSSIIAENQKRNSAVRLSPQEIEKTKQMLQKDVVQYNKDVQLLSLLIGRPLNNDDVAKLAATNLGKAQVKPQIPSSSLVTSTTTVTRQTSSSTSPVPAFKQLSEEELKFLQALQKIQTTRAVTTSAIPTTTPSIISTRSKSQEAILAELLKQQGIGPNLKQIGNQIPLDSLLQTLSSTTIRPFSPMPPLRRQPRPILDGLSWLWQTWQQTAPGYQPQAPRQQRPQQTFTQPAQLSFDDEFDEQPSGTAGSDAGTGGGNLLSYPQGGIGGNGLIGAAIGVTRAVSQFLGIAFTGAGRILQATLSGGSAASNIDGFGFGNSRL